MVVRINPEKRVGIEQFSSLPKVVWLARSGLTKYKLLLDVFAEYQNSKPRRKASQAETTFHVWSKAGGFDWKSDNTILVSIQTTVDFANYLSDTLGSRVAVTDK